MHLPKELLFAYQFMDVIKVVWIETIVFQNSTIVFIGYKYL